MILTPPVFELRSGLCGVCRHAEILRSKRSLFLRCGRSDQEPQYPRYPGLPLLACRGFEERLDPEPGEPTPRG